MGRLETPLEGSLRTIESMIEECAKEVRELRTSFNEPRIRELGIILAFLRSKRSDCYDELEGEDTEMV